MEDLIRQTLEEIDSLTNGLIFDEYQEYQKLPGVTEHMQQIIGAVLPILEEDQSNQAYVEQVNQALTHFSEAVSHRDTMLLVDTLVYEISGILQDILQMLEG